MSCPKNSVAQVFAKITKNYNYQSQTKKKNDYTSSVFSLLNYVLTISKVFGTSDHLEVLFSKCPKNIVGIYISLKCGHCCVSTSRDLGCMESHVIQTKRLAYLFNLELTMRNWFGSFYSLLLLSYLIIGKYCNLVLFLRVFNIVNFLRIKMLLALNFNHNYRNHRHTHTHTHTHTHIYIYIFIYGISIYMPLMCMLITLLIITLCSFSFSIWKYYTITTINPWSR